MAPVATTLTVPTAAPSATKPLVRDQDEPGVGLGLWPVDFEPTQVDYQKRLRIIENDDDERLSREISFPLVLVPRSKEEREEVSKGDLLTSIRKLSLPTSEEREGKSQSGSTTSRLRSLLDSNGGAIQFKRLPLRTADDFSEFVHALAGQRFDEGEEEEEEEEEEGKREVWIPHQDKGLMVIRTQFSKNVATANEGPSTQSIGFHNEYGLSSHFPSYIVFFCVSPPDVGGGGQTPIVSSLALYDRLKRGPTEAYLGDLREKGVTFTIHHPSSRLEGSVQGESVFKSTAFGPTEQEQGEEDREELERLKRKVVENHILDLAREGGWSPNLVVQEQDEEGGGSSPPPNWKVRGFSWDWKPDGSINVHQRVPGVRIHPTLGRPTYFNNIGNRYGYSKEHGAIDPPHHSKILAEGPNGERVSFPPPFYCGHGLPSSSSNLRYPPHESKDHPIPTEFMQRALELSQELASKVEWQTGDVLVLDNLAVQHAREPWKGDRRLLASLWDQPQLLSKAKPL
ncbi:Clavaminate synthase-like protein [Violaceomyces palustris]|uniref:Clavaminate synthase-like protein n=1 Tax=Violaceomyces palustris TaxID=1673888 RepID=A0ACD0NMV9_9BASI|nr:Clavaminate synthase-like protein [Violaceomyces palustris]